jgi:hypothetical protein
MLQCLGFINASIKNKDKVKFTRLISSILIILQLVAVRIKEKNGEKK